MLDESNEIVGVAFSGYAGSADNIGSLALESCLANMDSLCCGEIILLTNANLNCFCGFRNEALIHWFSFGSLAIP